MQPQNVLTTNSSIQLIKTLAHNSERAPLHANNNCAWSLNKNGNVPNLSAKSNNKLCLLSLLRKQNLRVTPSYEVPAVDHILLK